MRVREKKENENEKQVRCFRWLRKGGWEGVVRRPNIVYLTVCTKSKRAVKEKKTDSTKKKKLSFHA